MNDEMDVSDAFYRSHTVCQTLVRKAKLIVSQTAFAALICTNGMMAVRLGPRFLTPLICHHSQFHPKGWLSAPDFKAHTAGSHWTRIRRHGG